MWKIKIEYGDKSSLTLTGNHKDIPLRLAIKYHNEYVAGIRCKSTYQQYPKKSYPEMDLIDKIEQLLAEKQMQEKRRKRVRRIR